MFIDDVFTFDLRDPAGIPVTLRIDEAFDEENRRVRSAE